MKKSQMPELLKYVGEPSGIFGIKDYIFNDGRAKGVRAFDIKNGRGLELTVLPDRGLDIAYLSYQGNNIGFMSKAGISSPNFFVENEVTGFLRQFFGGFMTTGGISHAGPPAVRNGRSNGLHGVIDNSPAEQVNVYTEVHDDELILCVSGHLREAELFGDNLHLSRIVMVNTESNVITIKDTVENRGFRPSPVKILYHINFGYPMLNAGSRLYFSATDVIPRDKYAQIGIDHYQDIDAPTIGFHEQCFFHTGGEADAFAMIHNEKLGIAAVVHYDRTQCPLLCEWKSMAAGDYVLGLEPSSPGVFNQPEETYILAGVETMSYQVSIEITDVVSVIDRYKGT